MTVPASDLPSNLVPKDDLPATTGGIVPKDDLPNARPGASPLAVIGAHSPVARGGALDAPVRAAKIAQHKASINPLGAVDAFLGGPERFLFGLIGSHGDVGHAWQAMTHPGRSDDEDTDSVLSILHIPVAKGKDLGSTVERNAARLGVRVVGDPLNAVPLLAPFKVAARGIGLLESAGRAAADVGAQIPGIDRTVRAGRSLAQTAYKRANETGIPQMTRQVFGRRPELDPFLDKEMKGTRLGVEFKHRSYEAHANGEAEAALRHPEVQGALRDMVPGADLPPVVRTIQRQQMWRHGDNAMRDLAEEEGFVPTPDDLKAFPNPTGALTEKFFEDEPHEGGDQFSKVLEKIKMGNAIGRKEMVDTETENILNDRLADAKDTILKKRGLPPDAVTRMGPEEAEAFEAEARKRAGWRGDGPINVGMLSHDAKRAMPTSPLRAIGRLQKAAIKINPFPHGLKNVGMLAFLHGGPEAFGKGLAYASKGIGTEVGMHGMTPSERLVNMGVDADYVRDFEHPLQESALDEMSPLEAGVAKVGTLGPVWTNASNTILTRLELGYRQALLDQLDRKWPRLADAKADAMLDYKKGEVIRQVLGDYRNVNYFVSVLDALGGPFVAFRVGIVPGAVTRALLRRPNYVEDVAHGQQTMNSSPKGPSMLNIGGPVTDAADLAANPPGFFESPATLGPIGLGLRYADPNRTVSGGSLAEEGVRDFVPGGGPLEDLGLLRDVLGGGYSPAPGVSMGATAFASALGAYYSKRPNPIAERRYEAAERKAP